MTGRPARLVLQTHVLATLVVVLLAIPTVVWSGQVRERDPRWTAPSQDGSRSNPLAGRPETAAGGAKVFQQRCASCHGGDGRGTSKAPNLGQPDVQAQTDGALFWKISGGNAHTGMPAFSFLPEPQRWQLVLHLRTLSAEP